MTISYREDKCFTPEQVEALFLSVGWLSGKYPKRLAKALNGSDTVISAWDGSRLVGLVNAIDDGELTAYAHYVLVHSAYHGHGIGKELVRRLKEKYRGYLYLLLLADDPNNIPFYEQYGFTATGSTPMMIMTEETP
ncbi:GNAT family N-acetyltransferase [Agathobaculum sp.]|uniref:GNAT family N-acetyltransferase n=1 Tax=Agathobaculum sp. TaxID=2048138 RepID=UPI002A7F401C|nr:GNAT family N-acetyltransferase [Agathobaculum sp.]MDY3618796.1 GNAT family N-acetyltransferase [Agathobaculum sp.]